MTEAVAMQEWFKPARLGISIHWGIYAVNSTSESWSFFNGTTTREEYFAQEAGLTASAYDPDAWAELFHDAGARYAVLTTKHHDGIALWDTQVAYPDGSIASVVTRTPAGRDLVGGYVDAVRRAGLRVGLYFSHLDWRHPDYASLNPSSEPVLPPSAQRNAYSHPADGIARPDAWARFLKFHRAQLAELCELSPDLLWFDGAWERTPEEWQMKELAAFLAERLPRTVLNGRMGGHGDYTTQEQSLVASIPDGPWELCVTVNDSWGYRVQDEHHKSVRQIVQIFVDVLAGGGNLLLDVGPTESGVIPQAQADRLRGLGAWIRRNEEAVYTTVRGLAPGLADGPTTLSPDGRTLYLYLFGQPREFVVVRGLRTPIVRARVVGTGTPLPHDRVGGLHDAPGWDYVFIDAERNATDLDAVCTVVACEFDKPLALAPSTWSFD